MHRIDRPGNNAGHFTLGNKGAGVPATQLGADWPEAVQEEIIAVLTQAGITPNKLVNTQLRDAIIAIASAAAAPVGTIRMWGGLSGTVPAAHALANGAAVSRTGATAALFALFATRFGVGDGATTFNLPDLRGKYPYGATIDGDVGASVGANSVTATMQTAGAHTHSGNTGSTALTINQMPAHTHNYDALVTTSSHETGTGASEARGQVTTQASASQGGGQGHTHTIGSDGGHTHVMNAHDNRPASVGLFFIVRTT